MEQAYGSFTLVVREYDRLVEVCERFKRIKQSLREILRGDGVNALGKQYHPCCASRLNVFRPLASSRHDDALSMALLRKFAYPIMHMPYMVYALNRLNGIHMRK